MLLTSSDNHIKMWNTRVCPIQYSPLPLLTLGPQSGLCIRTIETHSETVTAIRWLPDNSGFISAGLDRRILIWVGVPPRVYPKLRNSQTALRTLKVTRGIPGGWLLFGSPTWTSAPTWRRLWRWESFTSRQRHTLQAVQGRPQLLEHVGIPHLNRPRLNHMGQVTLLKRRTGWLYMIWPQSKR